MKIAVDNSVLKNQFKYRGKGVYLRNLLAELPKAAPEIRIDFPPYDNPPYDLFFQPDSDGGLRRKLNCPQVVMFHDLTPLVLNRFSERGWLVNRAKKWRYHRNLQQVIQADFFLTNSEYTRKDLTRYLKLAPEKIGVTHLGVSQNFFDAFQGPEKLKKQQRVKQQVGGEFLLHVGGVEYNKNLLALIQAYAGLPNLMQQRFKLVIVGSQLQNLKKPETRFVHKLVQQFSLTGRIYFPGFVPEQDLPYWYQAAHLFIYPSLREGFGLPPLETMVSGTPAAVSRTASLPEICGSAAYYFDPADVDSIGQAIVECVGNKALRKNLFQAGLTQASRFTWQRTAQKTWEYIEACPRTVLGQQQATT